MSKLLSARLGYDTVAKLESAATRRWHDARSFNSSQSLMAMYLLGYVAEMRLAAAYFSLIGFKPGTQISRSDRNTAFAEGRQLNLMSAEPHDIAGWSRLLVYKKKQRSMGYPRAFEAEIRYWADEIYAQWRPTLRYRTIVPSAAELKSVTDGARWFEEHYVALKG